MVLEGLRAYLQLASGLTEVTRKRATAAARAVVAQGEAGVGAVLPAPMRAQVAVVADDLMATSKANRDLLLGLVRVEVERSVSRLGLVSAAELEAATSRARALDDRVQELERVLRAQAGGTGAADTGAAGSATATSRAKASAKPTTGSSARTTKPAKQRAVAAAAQAAEAARAGGATEVGRSGAPSTRRSQPATSNAEDSAAPSAGKKSASGRSRSASARETSPTSATAKKTTT